MADTIRTKAALQTLLATNGVGAIDAQDVRDFLVSVDPENAVGKGSYASIPAVQKGGFIWLSSDSALLARDNGSTYDYWGPLFPLSPPVDSGWTWVNQGSSTITAANGGLTMYQPGHSGDGISCYVKTAPATPWSLTVYQQVTLFPNNSTYAGLCFRQSSDGKLATFSIAFTGGAYTMDSKKWTNPTTVSAGYQSTTAVPFNCRWLRIKDDGSNRLCQWSDDGVNFVTWHSIGRTDFLTADQYGFFINAAAGTGKDCYQTLLSLAVA